MFAVRQNNALGVWAPCALSAASHGGESYLPRCCWLRFARRLPYGAAHDVNSAINSSKRSGIPCRCRTGGPSPRPARSDAACTTYNSAIPHDARLSRACDCGQALLHVARRHRRATVSVRRSLCRCRKRRTTCPRSLPSVHSLRLRLRAQHVDEVQCATERLHAVFVRRRIIYGRWPRLVRRAASDKHAHLE